MLTSSHAMINFVFLYIYHMDSCLYDGYIFRRVIAACGNLKSSEFINKFITNPCSGYLCDDRSFYSSEAAQDYRLNSKYIYIYI